MSTKLTGGSTRSYRSEQRERQAQQTRERILTAASAEFQRRGYVATAMRVVNAIPAGVAAPAGIRTTLDLPLITGRGLYSTG